MASGTLSAGTSIWKISLAKAVAAELGAAGAEAFSYLVLPPRLKAAAAAARERVVLGEEEVMRKEEPAPEPEPAPEAPLLFLRR